MLSEKQVRAMFAAQDEARANEEWRKAQIDAGTLQGEIYKLNDMIRELEHIERENDEFRDWCTKELRDEDFAVVLVGNAGHLGFDDLMSEARRVNDESAQAFLWSVEHALDGSDGR